MTFDDIIGQEQVKRILTENIKTGRIGHAYLFCGPDGVGRKLMAGCFAEAVTCEHCSENGTEVPCGVCEACILNKNSSNPDIITVRPQEGKASVGVEDVRAAQDEILTAPQYGRYKVFLFEHAEKMTPQAQNALLKTLEEPPPYVIIILMTSSSSLMLDTVRSRSVRIDFKRNTDAEVIEAFERASAAKARDTRLLCEYADGIIGRALEMADPEGYDRICDSILDCLKEIPKGGGRALCRMENLFSEYTDRKDIFFFTLYSLFRDIAMSARYKDAVLQNTRSENEIRKLGMAIGYHKAMDCIESIGNTWQLVSRNVNYKLAADSLSIRLQEVING